MGVLYLPQGSTEPSVALKIWEIILLDKRRNRGPDVKWHVPKHTEQSVAKSSWSRAWGLQHAIFPSRDPWPGPSSAPSLWARPRSMMPRPQHEEMLGLCIHCHGSQHFMHSYSNVLFQPDIEMLLKIMCRTWGKISLQASREAWDPVIKGSGELTQASFSAE